MIRAVTARGFGGAGRSGDGRVSAETRDVIADLSAAALVAAVTDLLPDHDGVREAGVPLFPQVGAVYSSRMLGCRPVPSRRGARRAGAGEPVDGVAGQTEPGGDLADIAALGEQLVYVDVPGRVRWAIRPVRGARSGGGAGSGAGSTPRAAVVGAVTTASRCCCCRVTARSTASSRLCHRCQPSAACTASGVARRCHRHSSRPSPGR